jgi:hypothetical protein
MCVYEHTYIYMSYVYLNKCIHKYTCIYINIYIHTYLYIVNVYLQLDWKWFLIFRNISVNIYDTFDMILFDI